jgi:enoyl-CoA hydratase/carnithine racemase
VTALVTVDRLSATPDVEGEGDRGLAVVTLQRPERRNALSIALRDEMSDALDALADDEALRVVVVTGAGAVFSAGFDLDEFGRLGEPEFAAGLWASSDRWHRMVLEFPLPLVAAVNGAAYGGGFDLAVMCDLRIASTSARFAHPEHSFSQVVYAPLHDLVGGAVARDLALTGRVVDAEEARAIGLVTRVVADDELLDDAVAVAREIARAPRAVLLAMKRKIARRAGITFGATLDL